MATTQAFVLPGHLPAAKHLAIISLNLLHFGSMTGGNVRGVIKEREGSIMGGYLSNPFIGF